MINRNLVCNEIYQGHIIKEQQRGRGRGTLNMLETDESVWLTHFSPVPLLGAIWGKHVELVNCFYVQSHD